VRLVENDNVSGWILTTHQRRDAGDLHQSVAPLAIPRLDDAGLDLEQGEALASLLYKLDAVNDEHNPLTARDRPTHDLAGNDGFSAAYLQGEAHRSVLGEG
jgi:hypothetical protein